MIPPRLIGLEAQVLPELSPGDVVRAAAAAGFDRVGLWIDVATWTPATTHDVRAAAAEGGIRVMEAEVVRLGDTVTDDQRRLIDIASEAGADHVLAIGTIDDHAALAAALAMLDDHAAAAGLRVSFEFGPFSAVSTLEEALLLVEAAGPRIGVMPDPIHLARGGGRPDDLAAIPPTRWCFAQLCDAGPPPFTATRATLLDEARFHRRDLSDGVLPLAAYVAALPAGLPISNEVRSRDLNRRLPDPFDRAAALATRMRARLAEWGP